MSEKYRISAEELQELGAKWCDQGAKSADMASEIAGSPLAEPKDVAAAATLSLASAVEGLSGNLLTAASAICDRLEHIESRIFGSTLGIGRGRN